MHLEKLFKRVILLDFFIGIILPIAWGMIQGSAHPSSEVVVLTNTEIVTLLLLPVYCVNLYLLYTFKPIGRPMYVLILAFMYGLTFGVPVEMLSTTNHFEYFLTSIGPMISGAILTMIYLTDIKKKFES